jgi:ribose transport system substrate-binding protein
MASWILANSNGAPHVLVANIPDYPILSVESQSLEKALSEQAPNSKVYSLTIPLAALGTTAPTLYVSFIRAHPDIQFIAPVFDGLYLGVPAALKAAGRTGVKVVTVASVPEGLQAIGTGTIDAGIAFDSQLSDFYSIDAFARLAVGEPVPGPTPYPKWIITKGHLPPIENNFPVTSGLDQYFTHLWGKS